MPSCFPHVMPRTQPALFRISTRGWNLFWVRLYLAELTLQVWQTIVTSWLNTFHHFKSVNKCHKVIQSSQTFLSFLQTRWAIRHPLQQQPSLLHKDPEQTLGQRFCSGGRKKKARKDWVKWPWTSINRAAAVKCCKLHSESCGHLSRMWNSVVPLPWLCVYLSEKQTSMKLTEDWISN